jgi:cytochrome c peroxidase
LDVLKKVWVILFIIVVASSFCLQTSYLPYKDLYTSRISDFEQEQHILLDKIKVTDLTSEKGLADIKEEIERSRLKLKEIDFWLRYLEPIAYKKINGPLPVEWENEVFEKFEPPYKREGAGLTLAELYLNEKMPNKDSLITLIKLSTNALKTFKADSITRELQTFSHFFYCNRMYLLNLAAFYTTGFECPDSKNIIPELRSMMSGVNGIYNSYNQSFPATRLPVAYLELYGKAMAFVNAQPADNEQFDHFSFIKNYVNPLFAINQKLIRQYEINSRSFNDYTLNNGCNSIFEKTLYAPQNTRGVYSLITDSAVLKEIRNIGKLLFYDPILSGNNSRSCVSCHKSKEYFTDTSVATSFNFDNKTRLERNTPTLINSIYNHLVMLDGKHFSLQNQGKDVMTNPKEMGGSEQEIITKVLSCKEYKSAFKKFLKYTPEEHEVTLGHIVSAITMYYKDFSDYYSPFDDAMNNNKPLSGEAQKGFNLFMSKAQCGTCHYVPQFNGVPPPYIGSEFEVVGVPEDKAYTRLSADKGRYAINKSFETMNAFRTGSIRNAEHTKPYMHNGVFTTLEEVIDFYDAGGGSGKKLIIANQSLSADSLRLTPVEKKDLLSFIHSLNEDIIFEEPPAKLPLSNTKAYNSRKVGGDY